MSRKDEIYAMAFALILVGALGIAFDRFGFSLVIVAVIAGIAHLQKKRRDTRRGDGS